MFMDSCTTKVLKDQLTEAATALPLSVFPAYVGSGNTVMSIDASGMQGLNHGVQRAFGSMSNAGDLYVMSHGRISDVIDPMNVLPYGYYTWEYTSKDLSVNEKNLPDVAAKWQRVIDLKEGSVTTSMLLGLQCCLQWKVSAPLGRNVLIFELQTRGYDYSNCPIPPGNRATMKMGLNMKTRAGNPVYDTAIYENGILHIDVQGHEQYKYSIKVSASEGARVYWNEGCLGVELDVALEQQYESYRIMFDFDGEAEIGQAETLLIENLQRREQLFEARPLVEGLSEKEAFLYNNTHYLLMSCFDMKKGLPIGSPFYFPWCWRCGTFWDSHFVMDGMMRCGARQEANDFLEYLHRLLHFKPNKPFAWMSLYDGTPAVADEMDCAPLVMCAHAMTAIKHYEYFQDREMLEKHGYPICLGVCEYAVNKLFGKKDGKWVVSSAVSNDVVEEAEDFNQTFTLLWFLTVFKKTLEIQEILGIDPNPVYLDIIQNYRIEKTEDEYMHSAGVTAKECRGASWVPFLLYPTEATPFIDMDLFNKTREKYTFPQLYMEKQGSYQPWTEFMEAQSDYRRKKPKEADALRQMGLSHSFGPGYFSEIGPRQQTVGLPPYISAHGTFLSSLIYQFIGTDIWDHHIELFTCTPDHYLTQPMKVTDVMCAGGIKVSAELNHNVLKAQFVPMEESCVDVQARIPANISKDNVHVLVNGNEIPYAMDSEGILHFKLDMHGVTEVSIG